MTPAQAAALKESGLIERLMKLGEQQADVSGDPTFHKGKMLTAADTMYCQAATALQSLIETVIEQGDAWQLIETAWTTGDTPIIVTDGQSVFGGGWWHSGEAAWLDCGGITPTHWQPLPAPPHRSFQ